MKIFVSHSIKDEEYLKNLQNMIKDYDLDLLIAEHEFETEGTITDKIKLLINSCDLGLVLLTQNGINSGFVREEIGYLEASSKKTIMVIEKGLEKSYGGFKYGADFIVIDPNRPTKGFEKVQKILLSEYKKLHQSRATQKSLFFLFTLLIAALVFGSSED